MALACEQILGMRTFARVGLVQIADRIDALRARVIGIAFHAVRAEYIDDDRHTARPRGSGREMVDRDFHNSNSFPCVCRSLAAPLSSITIN